MYYISNRNNPKPRFHHQRGAIMIGTTIIILATALVIAVSVQYLGVGELLLSFGEQQSEQSFQAADSCINEAILRLESNNAWSGSTLNVGSGTCTITVTGSGSTRTISSSATVGQSVRNLVVGISNLSGSSATITSWTEDTN